MLDNIKEVPKSNKLRNISNFKIAENLKQPLSPPGLPATVDYSKDSYLSKIRKNGKKIQKGHGATEWIQKWNKKF